MGTPPEDQPHSRQTQRRRISNPGRRATDFDPRTTITAKVLVGVVAAVNAFYLVGDTLINNGC